jgi:nitric oxide reductase NorE protein
MSTPTKLPRIESVSPSLDGDVLVSRDEAIAMRRWVPGEVGIWALILTDLGVFSVYFISFMWVWARNPKVFVAGHDAVSLQAGILNTFFLLTASLFVALGVQRIRLGQVVQTQRLFTVAGIAGLAFVGNKYFEWSHELGAGHTPRSDVFFQFYFILTGIHLVHVLIAMTLLRYMWRRAGQVQTVPTHQQSRFTENGASYWHMVDLLWLVLLALLYLMGRTL